VFNDINSENSVSRRIPVRPLRHMSTSFSATESCVLPRGIMILNVCKRGREYTGGGKPGIRFGDGRNMRTCH
jgi:hypothetical protein